MNRKDPNGRNIFGGGFLGLDNIGKNLLVFFRLHKRPVVIYGKEITNLMIHWIYLLWVSKVKPDYTTRNSWDYL